MQKNNRCGIGTAVLCLMTGLFSTAAFGQKNVADSTVKDIQLKEVLIMGKDSNSTKSRSADVQSATDDIMDAMPGVELIRRGNFAPEPMIRSMNAGQINVVLDGMKMFGACTDRMDPVSSYIEPNNLQSIGIGFGPGANAMGATIGGGINFKLKQPELDAEKKVSGLVGFGYQTNAKALQALTTLQYSTRRFALLVDGLYRSAQDYTAGGGEKIQFSQYRKWNGNIAAKYLLGRHSYLVADYLQDDGYNIGYPALLMDVKFAKANVGSLYYVYEDNSRKLYKWETKVYANKIDHAMDDSKRPADQVPMHMDMPGQSHTLGFYSEAFIAISPKNTLRAKVEGYQNRLHAEMTMYPEGAPTMFMLTIPDGQRQVIGLDLSDHLSLSNKWEANFGGRLEYDRSTITTPDGMAQISSIYSGNPNRNDILYNLFGNIVYKPTGHLNVSLNLARGMRNSTLNELYGVYLFNRVDGYDYFGNPALKKEQSYNVELSTKYHKGILSVQEQAFIYFIKNYIAGEVQPGFNPMTSVAEGVKQYVNLPSAKLYGGELSLQLRLMKHLSLSSVNTYTRGLDGNKNALPLIAPFRSVNTLAYGLNNWGAYVESVTAVAQRHVSDFYGEAGSPSFSILNAKLSKKFAIRKNQLECVLEVKNILDQNYYEHLDVFMVPRPGRDFIGHITFFF